MVRYSTVRIKNIGDKGWRLRKSLLAYLNFERVAHFDALHPLRAQHVVRDQLHLCRQGEANHLLTTTTRESAEMWSDPLFVLQGKF